MVEDVSGFVRITWTPISIWKMTFPFGRNSVLPHPCRNSVILGLPEADVCAGSVVNRWDHEEDSANHACKNAVGSNPENHRRSIEKKWMPQNRPHPNTSATYVERNERRGILTVKPAKRNRIYTLFVRPAGNIIEITIFECLCLIFLLFKIGLGAIENALFLSAFSERGITGRVGKKADILDGYQEFSSPIKKGFGPVNSREGR